MDSLQSCPRDLVLALVDAVLHHSDDGRDKLGTFDLVRCCLCASVVDVFSHVLQQLGGGTHGLHLEVEGGRIIQGTTDGTVQECQVLGHESRHDVQETRVDEHRQLRWNQREGRALMGGDVDVDVGVKGKGGCSSASHEVVMRSANRTRTWVVLLLSVA